MKLVLQLVKRVFFRQLFLITISMRRKAIFKGT